jgi:glycosyltransferase involved in cell wall biosynthesis
MVVERASGLACTTRAGADDLIAYINENSLPHPPGLRIGVCPLGADFVNAPAVGGEAINMELGSILNREKVFAMVGTIEPRKNHATVLDAFDALWRKNTDATLVIIGKSGWMVDDLMFRIEDHPEYGKRLFRLGFVSDSDLRNIYQSVDAVIMASHAEGFGLPIFEASHHGAALVLSDIPVFREIAGGHASYFPVTDSIALARLLEENAGHREHGGTLMRPRSWAESAKSFRDFVLGRATYFRFE